MYNYTENNFKKMKMKCSAVSSLLFSLLLLSCATTSKTEYIPYEVPGKVEYISRVIRDSIYLSEKEYSRGDTVYLTKYEYHLKLRTDTIRDTIPAPYPVPYEVKVDNPIPYIPKAYRVLSAIGVLSLLLAILKMLLKKKPDRI